MAETDEPTDSEREGELTVTLLLGEEMDAAPLIVTDGAVITIGPSDETDWPVATEKEVPAVKLRIEE